MSHDEVFLLYMDNEASNMNVADLKYIREFGSEDKYEYALVKSRENLVK